jgi:hypothetical protein
MAPILFDICTLFDVNILMLKYDIIPFNLNGLVKFSLSHIIE